MSSNWYSAMYKERLDQAFVEALKESEILKDWAITVNDPSGQKATSCGFLVQGWSKDRVGGIKVIIDHYPACCAFYQMNYFTYNCTSAEKFVPAFLDLMVQVFRKAYSNKFAQKLVLNTVQQQIVGCDDPGFLSPRDANLYGKDTGERGIYYPEVHKWAKNQEGGCVDVPIVNHNTHNIIHHLITFIL